MVTKILMFALAVWLQLLATSSVAMSVFNAAVTSNEVQYGKSVTLTLSAADTGTRLNNIDLRELEAIFYVDKKADITVDEQTGMQHWKLRLSPYHKGKLIIPSLYFNQTRSQPIELKVSDALDIKTGTPIRITRQLSTQQPWLREQVLVSYQLQTQFPRAQIKVAETKAKHALIQALDIDYKIVEAATHDYRTGWAIFPLKAGQMHIKLPPVELVRDGVTTHRFYTPPVNLAVQALPLYIPATIPVGTVQLEMKQRERYLLQNSLADYRLSLVGDRILAINLPEISNQISSTRAIRIYPETRQVTQENTATGINSRVNYQFPVKVLDQGHARLDEIRLSYFDTSNGTLRTHTYPNLSVLSINKWLMWLLVVILLVFMALAAIKLTRWLTRFYHKLRLYLQAIKQLKTDCSPEQLKGSIAILSHADGHSANTTIDNWFETVTGRIKTDTLRDELRRLLYQQRPVSVPQTIREEVLKIAYANLPIIGLFNKIHPRL